MLGYEQFREELLNSFSRQIAEQFEGYHLEHEKVFKTNTVLESLSIKADEVGKSSISPVMYVEAIYDGYLSSDMEAANYIDGTFKDYVRYFETGQSMLKDDDNDIEKMCNKDTLFPQVINAERNREYLKNKPHRLFLDLAVIYRFDAPAFNGTIIVNDSIAKHLGLSEEALYESAMKNLEDKYRPEMHKMSEILGLPAMDEVDDTLYVVTNKEKNYGANALLLPSFFEDFSEKTDGNFYIIPSSLHEVLIVRDAEHDPGGLQEIIQQVNEMACVGDDFLSDNLYKFNAETKQIEYAMPDQVKSKERNISTIEEKKPEKDVKVI